MKFSYCSTLFYTVEPTSRRYKKKYERTLLDERHPAKPWSKASWIVQASIRGRSAFGPKNRSSLKFRFLALSVNSRYIWTGLFGDRNSLLVRSADRGVFRFDTPADGAGIDVRICRAGLFIREFSNKFLTLVGCRTTARKNALIEIEAVEWCF